jgi:DNA invertase Pin-like site-specific DNA recombinase
VSAKSPRQIRCAVYTRKSTEHGLDLAFTSLDAQREACEAYIKSQASQGWRLIPKPYDDAAFSGGNLERPALKELLADIAARQVDVVVVYKIDRLTRSLADFARLVELFDAHSVSFVAVTQQFNTTSSMGRLTLNVLLSFAQFERELSSERVRDKIAASRRKGQWTGGTVPLGYDAIDKKLVINPTEAETVRTIFRLYLEIKSFGRLVRELDRRGIVTKERQTRNPRYDGGIPFRYGALAYLLKNRIKNGQHHRGGKRFAGEHEPLHGRALNEDVQALNASHAVRRRNRSASGALLAGLIHDDRGNRMSPSFTLKDGVRYRFYVSTALLRGRKADAGTIGRIKAATIEKLVLTVLRHRQSAQPTTGDNQLLPIISQEADTKAPAGDAAPTEADRNLIADVDRIVITTTEIRIWLKDDEQPASAGSTISIEAAAPAITIPWVDRSDTSTACLDPNLPPVPDPKLIHAVVRARLWLQALDKGHHASIDDLAATAGLHPKIVRLNLRLAFLPPDIITAIMEGRQPPHLTARTIPQTLPLSWHKQRRVLINPDGML